jgi:hypothetical protein
MLSNRQTKNRGGKSHNKNGCESGLDIIKERLLRRYHGSIVVSDRELTSLLQITGCSSKQDCWQNSECTLLDDVRALSQGTPGVIQQTRCRVFQNKVALIRHQFTGSG